jgi:hypothetical protein
MSQKIYVTLSKKRAVILPQNVNVTEVIEKSQGQGKPKTLQKVRRTIRYVEDLDSIYVDEQKKVDPDATQTNIAINKGVLKVDEDNHVLIKYLEVLPQNQANGGTLFKELIVDEEDRFELDRYKRITGANEILANADEKTTRAIGLEFIGQGALGKTPTKIKLMIRPLIDADKDNFIERFVKFSKSNLIDEKILLAIALDKGVLKVENGKNVKWGIDTEETVFVGSQAGSVLDEIATWFNVDSEGKTILASVAKKVKELK